MALPFLFMRILIKRFTRKISLQLYPDYFVTKIPDQGGNETEKKIDLDKLASYSIQFPNEKFSSIKFKLHNNDSFEYSFFQKKQNDGDSDGIELINSFHSMIKNYNSTLNTNKIEFKPSFYATNAGLTLIITLSVILVVAILLSYSYSQKSLPITFIFSFILILQLIIKRRKELNYYNSMR